MSKKVKPVSGDTLSRLNRIKPTTNFLFNLMFLILALACFLPIIFIFIISVTDNDIIRKEYSGRPPAPPPAMPTSTCGASGRPSSMLCGCPSTLQ